MDGIDLQKRRREHIRWLVLRALDNARPIGFPENPLLEIVRAFYEDASRHELRRELDYLEDRGLIAIAERHTGHWRAELQRHGVDIVEYAIECEPGIARPPKGL
ncbi:MAG: hypothetical protein JSS44_09020 [Proteobacteria bacterium]|nr:hypothetical protein [Pseudomonadota bacterium]MBS0461758.1 hypothetical protein [Pseudomonadota bacterium]